MKKIKLDSDMAKIVSYVTFDGHLAEDLKGFYLSSKNKETLALFEQLVFKKFQKSGRLEEGSRHYGESYKYRVFSRDICRFLENIGTPKGCKVKKIFLVPKWIKNNKECSREYLKVAFDCEGSIWTDTRTTIRFGIFKSEEHLDNLIEFVEELKTMLKRFNIDSTNTWIRKGNKRKDGKITKGAYFNIKTKSVGQFAKEVHFTDRFKSVRLSSAQCYPQDEIIQH